MAYLLVFLALAVAAVALLGLAGYSSIKDKLRAVEADNRRLQTLVEDVKELSWSHRELDSALSTIIIDTIRSAQREDRPELP